MRIRFLVAVAVLALPSLSSAATIQVGPGAFSSSATLITFDTLAEDQQVTNDFLAFGVDFSSSSFVAGSTAGFTGSEFYPFYSSPGAGVLQNYTDFCATSASFCQNIIIDFPNPFALVGFEFISNAGTSSFTVFTSSGSTVFNIATGIPEAFIGFFDPAGITRIVLAAPANNAMSINDLQVEAVPEPATLLLLGTGLGALAAKRRRAMRR